MAENAGYCVNDMPIHLRRPTPDDETLLYQLDNDPEVMRWINGGLNVDPDTFRRDLMPVYLAEVADPVMGFWLIEVEGEFAGWVSLRWQDERVASLGYRIARSFWGRGLATEAGRLMIRQGFDRAGLTEIVATTYEENSGSIRVMEKLGMQFRRRFRFDVDTPSDTAVSDGAAWSGDDVEYVITL